MNKFMSISMIDERENPLKDLQKTHIKRNNLTSSVSVKEIEFIVKLGPHDFAHKLYQTLKEY